MQISKVDIDLPLRMRHSSLHEYPPEITIQPGNPNTKHWSLLIAGLTEKVLLTVPNHQENQVMVCIYIATCFPIVRGSIVKPALVTTCIQRPPLFKDHLFMSQLHVEETTSIQRPLVHVPIACGRDHLYSKTTSIQRPLVHVPIACERDHLYLKTAFFFWPNCGILYRCYTSAI